MPFRPSCRPRALDEGKLMPEDAHRQVGHLVPTITEQ